MKTPRDSGFTLVELAIVMTIIGLLIGGVLQGRTLIYNARITSLIEDVQAYEAATITFRDQYFQKPGDISIATRRLPNCAPPNCFDGNGDNTVGQAVSSVWLGDLIALWTTQLNSTNPLQRETFMFFRHLVIADLITGVIPTADMTAPQWGETHPATAFGGGFHVATVRGTASVINITEALPSGTYLLLRKSMSAPLAAGQNPVSSKLAWQIDKKVDDGKADSGFVVSPNLSNVVNCMPYDPTDTSDNCTLGFKLQL